MIDPGFTKGKYRQPLTTEDFLRAVGKPEDAETYLDRRFGAGLLTAGSLLSLLAGAASTGAEGAGMGVTSLIAVVLFGGAMVVYPSPPDPVEMRRLADEHNQVLRLRLSVSGRF